MATSTDTLVLHIGDKNWSSWSLRPWLALKQAGLSFEERVHPLRQPTTSAELAAVSPTGKVPVLHVAPSVIAGATWPNDIPLVIWDSLAIIEWTAERCAKLWPINAGERAIARAISSEMHSGFAPLRQHLSMDICASVPYDASLYPEAVHADIRRVIAIWEDCRARFGIPSGKGPFLFGAFTAADAMYAPVVTRFRTYNVPLPKNAQAYAEAIWELPAMQEWIQGARDEVAKKQ